MMYLLVLDLAADGVPVTVTCRVLGFSKQAFTSGKAAPVGQRDWDDAHLINAGCVAIGAVDRNGLSIGLAGDSSCGERVEPWSRRLVPGGGGGDVLARGAVGAGAVAGAGGVVSRARFGPAVIPPPVLAAGLATRHRHPRSRYVQGSGRVGGRVKWDRRSEILHPIDSGPPYGFELRK
jgi:hypothetical protein